jgi:predicted metal-dependent peptidase
MIDLNETEYLSYAKKLVQATVYDNPGFGEILSYIPIVCGSTVPTSVACTDGTMIGLAPDFFRNYKPEEQGFILLHEALHVAFRHRSRKEAYIGINNTETMAAYDIAIECIVNQALISLPTSAITCPDDATTFNKVLTAEQQDFKPLSKWCTESLVEYLLYLHSTDQCSKSLNNMFKSYEADVVVVNLSTKDTSNSASNGEDNSADDVSSSKVELKESTGKDKSEIEELIWDQRLKRLASSYGDRNSLTSLLNDIPVVNTPWQEELKAFLTRNLLTERQTTWRRPHRLYTAGILTHFMPFSQKKPGIKTIAVLLDLSGSCFSKEVIAEFAANIDEIQGVTGSEILLITFDHKVNEVINITSTGGSFSEKINNNEFTITGGGGTSFIEPFQEVEKHNVDVVVVLTDGYGEFPDSTTVPEHQIIWGMTDKVVAPFGKTIVLMTEYN